MYRSTRPANRGHKNYKHDTTRPTMNKEIDIDTGKKVRIVWQYAHRHAFMWREDIQIWLG